MRRGVQSGMKGGRKKAEKGGKKEDSSGHAKALPINAISGISDPADPLFLETEPVPATYIIQVIYFMMSEGLVVLVCDVSIVTTWFGFQPGMDSSLFSSKIKRIKQKEGFVLVSYVICLNYLILYSNFFIVLNN